MVKFLLSVIFGKCRISCDSADAEMFIDIIRVNSLTTDPIKFSNDKYFVTLTEWKTKKLRELSEKHDIKLEIKRLWGIPLLFNRYRHRPGIFLGIIIFFLIISLSGSVIWDFEITGNTRISDTEIIHALDNLGCGPGAFIENIDFDLLQNDCLIDRDELAWISVNMDGNLAKVEVRERRTVPLFETPTKGRFANIIAAEDGVIEICRVKNGKSVVEQGDVVKKGELLISGVIDVGDTGVRYEYADGEVLARVYREFCSYVPYNYAKQIPTGEKKAEIQLKIFGKSINLSRRGSIDWPVYGKIKEEEKLSLPFGITLPIWMQKTVYSELSENSVLLSEEEAVSMAKAEVSTKLQDMADTLQLLSVSEDVEIGSEGVRVTLGVYGVTDISANYGFSVSDGGTEENGDKPKNEENGNG